METIGYLELTIVFVTFIFSVISIVGSVVFRLYYHRNVNSDAVMPTWSIISLKNVYTYP